MRLGQTSVVYFVSRIGASLIGFLATVYFTRTLGEEIYGFYAVTIALVSWLGIVKSVGFGRAIVKRMSEGDEPDEFLAAGATIQFVLTAIVGAGVLRFRDSVDAYVGQPVAELVVVLLVVSVFSELVNAALKGSHRVHIYAPLSTGKELARSLLMVGLVVLSWELTGMLVGHAVGTAVVAVIGLVIVSPTLVRPRMRHVRQLFDFAKYAWLGSLRRRSFTDADIVILGLFVSPALTGVYAVAYTLSAFLNVFGNAIKNTLFPEMSKLSSEDDWSMVGTLTTDALAFAGLFLVPGVVGALVLGDRLMAIYGPGFRRGDAVLVLLLAGVLVYTYAKQLLNTLDAIDRPDLAFRANGAFVVTNISLNLLLVWQYGWLGAAVGTVLSAVVGLVLAFWYVRQQIPLSVPYDELGRQWVAAAAMGVVVYGAREFGEESVLTAHNELFVVVLVGLGAVVYFLVLLAISTRFRETVARNLPFSVPLLGP